MLGVAPGQLHPRADGPALTYSVVARERRPLRKHLPSLQEARCWAVAYRAISITSTCTVAPIEVVSVDAKDWLVMQFAIPSHDARRAQYGDSSDGESFAWVRALSGTRRERDEASERLHALLLRAARFEVARRQRAAGVGGGSGDIDDFAVHAADDALIAILRKLHTYRGDSRFTTWAYKFALLEAAATVRRRAWQGREIPLEAEGWARLLDDGQAAPESHAEASELFDALRDAIADELSPHQRAVLVAITLNDVPIDVLAERRGTTRSALYKTLHDARRKLRARLAMDGLAIEPALSVHSTEEIS